MARTGERSLTAGLAWTSPWLVGGTLFVLVPMALSLYYSFTDYTLLEGPIWVGLDNYRRMLGDERLWLTLGNTALYTALAVPAATVLALVLAGLLSAKVRWARGFQAAVFLPTLVPLVASAMVWMWLFNAEYGLINRALSWVGVPGPNWLKDRWVMVSLVLMSLWGVGQSVVVYIAAMREVPEQLYEAAKLDGMGPVRRFVHVTLPMISPVILFNVITLVIAAVQVFAVPYIMFRQPGYETERAEFYSMYLYDNAFVHMQMGYACAMAWVQLVAILGLTGLLFWASRRLVYYRAG